MINVIKTAIVTIIISIISGLLVEHIKNVAPRILCKIGRGIPIKIGTKKVYAYNVTVSNLSKKIVHDLTLNIQSLQSSLKIADAKITKGLKFDSSTRDNMVDIAIPFLGKSDKFSVTVYVEDHRKPVIVLRSPENFKEIDSEEKQGVLSSLFNKTKNENKADSSIIETISHNKKIIIAAVSIVLVIIAGVFVKTYFSKASNSDTQTSSTEQANSKKSNGSKKSTSVTNENSGTKSSTSGTSKNEGTKSSTSGTNTNSGSNTSTSGTSTNSGSNTSNTGTSENSNSNTSTSTNSGTNTSTSGAGNSDTKTSTDGAGGSSNTTSKSTDETNGSSSTQASGTTGNTSK